MIAGDEQPLLPDETPETLFRSMMIPVAPIGE